MKHYKDNGGFYRSSLWKDAEEVPNFADTYAYEVSRKRKVMKFRNFLKLSENEESLLKFVTGYILEHLADK